MLKKLYFLCKNLLNFTKKWYFLQKKLEKIN